MVGIMNRYDEERKQEPPFENPQAPTGRRAALAH
jgi:hypothetical protein